MSEETTQDVQVRLNKSIPYSENRGEMQPDDPHYHVAYWQGEVIKCPERRRGPIATTTRLVKKMILLPFDAEGNLVPDDGRKEPWNGVDADNKPLKYFPLWNDDMRLLLKKKIEEVSNRDPDEEEEIDIDWVSGRINWVAWLKGGEKHDWNAIKEGAKKIFGKNFTSKKEIVEELVNEREIVAPEQLCEELRGYAGKVKEEA